MKYFGNYALDKIHKRLQAFQISRNLIGQMFDMNYLMKYGVKVIKRREK